MNKITERPFHFWGAVFTLCMGLVIAYIDKSFFGNGAWVVWGNIGASLFNFALLYFQKIDPKSKDGTYGKMISELSGMTKSMDNLKVFLESEKARVDETKELIRALKQEKSDLEPVVEAHRETVDSIFKAYEKNKNKSTIKPIALGFVVGILSSITASYILDYLNT